MRAVLLALAVLMAFLLTGVRAQDEPTTAPPPTTVAPGVTVDANQALVVYIEETIVNTDGQFAGVAVYLQAADAGWTRLTPCDDLIVRCDIAYLRMEDAIQGDRFVLQPYEGP